MSEKINQLAREIVKLRERIEGLGGFDDSRELLECPHCRLMEDVTFEGVLITSHEGELGIDTGMRFTPQLRVSDKWICPACETQF